MYIKFRIKCWKWQGITILWNWEIGKIKMKNGELKKIFKCKDIELSNIFEKYDMYSRKFPFFSRTMLATEVLNVK
jgi:hypothetical protein